LSEKKNVNKFDSYQFGIYQFDTCQFGKYQLHIVILL
jgi:hypothetical protein